MNDLELEMLLMQIRLNESELRRERPDLIDSAYTRRAILRTLDGFGVDDFVRWLPMMLTVKGLAERGFVGTTASLKGVLKAMAIAWLMEERKKVR